MPTIDREWFLAASSRSQLWLIDYYRERSPCKRYWVAHKLLGGLEKRRRPCLPNPKPNFKPQNSPAKETTTTLSTGGKFCYDSQGYQKWSPPFPARFFTFFPSELQAHADNLTDKVRVPYLHPHCKRAGNLSVFLFGGGENLL